VHARDDEPILGHTVRCTMNIHVVNCASGCVLKRTIWPLSIGYVELQSASPKDVHNIDRASRGIDDARETWSPGTDCSACRDLS
jgi:hypothetical protein